MLTAQPDAAPIAGSLALKQLSTYIAGICVVVAFLVSATLMFLRATHLSRPREQTKIIRITALIPTFALIYLINIDLGASAVYLTPWGTVCEAIALTSFFFLVCDYLSPDLDSRTASYEPLDLSPTKGSDINLSRLRRTRTLVCQYIFVDIIVAIVIDITQAAGKFCGNSNSVHFAHIWLTLIHAFPAIVAIVAIIGFTKRMHSRLRSHSIVLKLIALKLIVGLDFIQTGISACLFPRRRPLPPNRQISYLGITVYLPTIMFCVEMTVFSIVFHYVYSYRPYITNRTTSLKYQGGPLGIYAIGQALNLVDVFREIVQRF